MAKSAPSGPFGQLPYGPVMTRALPAMHRGFLVVNKYLSVPALRMGLGSLMSTPVAGYLMILRTRGRKSGETREAPLGYVIKDGCVYVWAGFGVRTQWYRNILADPHVECLLPSAAFAGIAETVTDPEEWLPAATALRDALGVIGRLTITDPAGASEEELEELRTRLPLVRIRPTGIAAGPADPGGLGWVVVQVASIGLTVRWSWQGLRWLGRRLRP